MKRCPPRQKRRLPGRPPRRNRRARGSLGLFGRARKGGPGGPVDWLVVGLGNPGSRYAGTRHNVGFEVAAKLSARWEMPRARRKYRGLITSGRVSAPVEGLASAGDQASAIDRAGAVSPGVAVPTVAVLLPQTFMNEAGHSVGPAAGEMKVPPERVLVIHDEIDLPFGEVRSRRGGGIAGHNGLRSVRAHLGTTDFRRLRVGVGRPRSTDPEVVSAYVLARFREPKDLVRELVKRAVEKAEGVILESLR